MSAPTCRVVTLHDLTVPAGLTYVVEILEQGLEENGIQPAIVAEAQRRVRVPLRRVWRRVAPSAEETLRIAVALRRLRARLGERSDPCLALDAWSAAASVDAGCPTVFRMAGLGSITDEWIRNGFIAARSPCVGWLRKREMAGTLGASRVVAQAAAGRERLLELGVADERIVVISNGVAIPEPIERPTRDDVHIVCVANLRHVKGVDMLADAVARLPRALARRVRVTHLGDGNAPGNPTYERAKEHLAGSGVRFTFRGAVWAEKVQDTLRDADLFVLPSRVEMFPNALLEAMAAGLPTITSDVGAVREILGPAADGDLITPPEDAEALAEAIAALVDDADRRARLGAANRERVASTYSLDRMMARYAEVLREVAATR